MHFGAVSRPGSCLIKNIQIIFIRFCKCSYPGGTLIFYINVGLADILEVKIFNFDIMGVSVK